MSPRLTMKKTTFPHRHPAPPGLFTYDDDITIDCATPAMASQSIAGHIMWLSNCYISSWKVIHNSLDFDFIHDYIHGRSCKKFSSLYLKLCWLIIARSNKNTHKGIFCNDDVFIQEYTNVLWILQLLANHVSLIDIPITECMLDKKVFDLAINRDNLGGLRLTVFTQCFMSWPQNSTRHTPEFCSYGRRWHGPTENQSLFTVMTSWHETLSLSRAHFEGKLSLTVDSLHKGR